MEDHKKLDSLINLPIDGKKRILIFAKDCLRDVLLPKNDEQCSKITFIDKSKYQNLINNSKKFRATQKKEGKRNLGDSIVDRKCISSRNKFKNIFKTSVTSKTETPSKRKERVQICVENEEAIKLLNSEIIKVKCTSILNKQIEQKNDKRKSYRRRKQKENTRNVKRK